MEDVRERHDEKQAAESDEQESSESNKKARYRNTGPCRGIFSQGKWPITNEGKGDPDE